MEMTVENIRRAGEMSRQFAWTDSELALVISATELTVAFLEGKGSDWALALSPLRRELEQLQRYAEHRKANKSPDCES